MAAVDGPLQPGTRLGDFLILHALGSGGMGVVYAAQQDRPRRTVAVKVLRRGFRHPEIVRRFEYEAEMLGRLQHAGIAQVYAFRAGDRSVPAYLVMELVSGPPLTDYARAQQLSIRDRVGLVVKLADAIQHAHDRGVIHRDLKPANVLVAEGGQPKVLDFGIARATGADVHRITMHTAHGQLMGTLAYMSPEQLSGRSAEVDARSDVHALGVLLYRILAERLPFEVSDVPWPEAIQRVLEAAPAPLGAVNAALAGPLEQIVARAMSRDIAGRYQTASGLADDLRRFLEGREPSAAPAEPAVRAGEPVRGAESQPPPTAFAADADTLCVATHSGRITATCASTGEPRWTAKLEGVRTLAASVPARSIAAGLASGFIELLELDTGLRIASLDARRGPVAALAFSADAFDIRGRGRRVWNGSRPASSTFRTGRRTVGDAVADGRTLLVWHDGRVHMLAGPADDR